jgi:hypothetical protein
MPPKSHTAGRIIYTYHTRSIARISFIVSFSMTRLEKDKPLVCLYCEICDWFVSMWGGNLGATLYRHVRLSPC